MSEGKTKKLTKRKSPDDIDPILRDIEKVYEMPFVDPNKAAAQKTLEEREKEKETLKQIPRHHVKSDTAGHVVPSSVCMRLIEN